MKDDKSASKKEVESTKKLEKQKKEYRKHVENTLKVCSFTEVDDKHYSLIFNNKKFTFHLPSFLEKTKIKAILSQIAYTPAGTLSGELDIESSGDLSLRCSTMLFTRISVLSDKKDYDLDSLNESDQFNFGYFILLSEQELLELKKKVSIEER